MLEICIGHVDQSFVYHVAEHGSSAWGYQPDLAPGLRFFDHAGGVPSEA
jgi:hypothetical protein